MSLAGEDAPKKKRKLICGVCGVVLVDDDRDPKKLSEDSDLPPLEIPDFLRKQVDQGEK